MVGENRAVRGAKRTIISKQPTDFPTRKLQRRMQGTQVFMLLHSDIFSFDKTNTFETETKKYLPKTIETSAYSSFWAFLGVRTWLPWFNLPVGVGLKYGKYSNPFVLIVWFTSITFAFLHKCIATKAEKKTHYTLHDYFPVHVRLHICSCSACNSEATNFSTDVGRELPITSVWCNGLPVRLSG